MGQIGSLTTVNVLTTTEPAQWSEGKICAVSVTVSVGDPYMDPLLSQNINAMCERGL